jgi:hypothetical protein
MCVLALRKTNADGPNRTFTRVIRDENGKDAWHAVRERIAEGSTLTADEHHSYNKSVRLLAESCRTDRRPGLDARRKSRVTRLPPLDKPIG